VLSALVVKGSFFIAVRLWFDAMPNLPGQAAAQLLSALGAAAILLGSVVALRQRRLKLLIAYSTLAQIGYLFLMFALAIDPASARLASGDALAGGILQTITHATAKAAMFMAAGLIYGALGHDRIAGLGGIGRVSPLGVLAFGLAGLALMGVPPGGAALAKDLLLHAAAETGQWWWAWVLHAGGVLTSSYVFLVIVHALAPAEQPVPPRARAPLLAEGAVLALALVALSLGLVPWEAALPLSGSVPSSALDLAALWKLSWPALAGALLAVLLGRWEGPWRLPARGILAAGIAPVRSAALAASGVVERSDTALRHWPAAGLSLLLLAVLFGAAMLAAGRAA
jgi:formate hydrogenlyase subunit 3/multisubunit Na+/H+ antiporter MnhD subunit